MTETKEEKSYKEAYLQKGKDWRIVYYVCRVSGDIPVRQRLRVPDTYGTEKARNKFADEQIKKINKLLAKGFFVARQIEPGRSAGSGCNRYRTKQKIEAAVITKDSMFFAALYKQLEILKHLRGKRTGTHKSANN